MTSGQDSNAFAQDQLLTVAMVAARLCVCKATVYKLCAQGKLRHLRVANAVRVPVDALAEFLHAPK